MIVAQLRQMREEWRHNRRLRLGALAILMILGTYAVLMLSDRQRAMAEAYERDAVLAVKLEQVAREDASISTLASRFDMTLTGMKKHVGVLEQAGLVTTVKIGRVRTCRLGRARLEQEAAWIENYRRQWAARFAALDQVLEDLKREETRNERNDG